MVDERVILKALEMQSPDFEDSVTAAELAECDLIVTRDPRGFSWIVRPGAGARGRRASPRVIQSPERLELRYPFGPRNSQNDRDRSEEHTSELQSLRHLVCRLLLEK